MSIITRIIILCLAFIVAGYGSEARARKSIKVIASFSILGDMVKNVGGDRVDVITLVGPNGDVHVFEPTPATAREVSEADLIVVNGLGLEGWIDRLIKASGYKGMVAVASRGVRPRQMEEGEHEGGGKRGRLVIDPHAWQDIRNGSLYVDNIAEALDSVDPAGASTYKANADAYRSKLIELDKWVRSELSGVPRQKRSMITTHDAFGYFGAAYGVRILSPMGVSTESEPSAGEVKKLIRQIKKEKITAVFMENVADPRMIRQIAEESGVMLGGELFSDALSKPGGPASTYIDMFKNNVTKIVSAMKRGL
jgi:zinc/manganese transport system substrate-binding protein